MRIETKLPVKRNGKIQKIEYQSFEIDVTPVGVDGALDEVYQNSPEIKNILMEDKSIGEVGCRFIGGYRVYKYLLKNKYRIKNTLTVKELDALADEGGWKDDCWADNINNPIYNVINFWCLTDKINRRYKIDIEYKHFKSLYDSITLMALYRAVESGIPLLIKMPSLSNTYPDHFVNVVGALKDKETLYFRMKETMLNTETYKGYDGYWVESNIPGSYEVFI